jgi:hypothetical protein
VDLYHPHLQLEEIYLKIFYRSSLVSMIHVTTGFMIHHTHYFKVLNAWKLSYAGASQAWGNSRKMLDEEGGEEAVDTVTITSHWTMTFSEAKGSSS